MPVSDPKQSRRKLEQTQRPIASASISGLYEDQALEPEIARQMISDISVALLGHVAEQMRALSVDVPSCAEPMEPTLRMIEEVCDELDSYRAILEQS